jgi:hypothetical protein
MINSGGQTIFLAGAHRDGKRLIVHTDDKLSALVKLGRQALNGDVISRFQSPQSMPVTNDGN